MKVLVNECSFWGIRNLVITEYYREMEIKVGAHIIYLAPELVYLLIHLHPSSYSKIRSLTHQSKCLVDEILPKQKAVKRYSTYIKSPVTSILYVRKTLLPNGNYNGILLIRDQTTKKERFYLDGECLFEIETYAYDSSTNGGTHCWNCRIVRNCRMVQKTFTLEYTPNFKYVIRLEPGLVLNCRHYLTYDGLSFIEKECPNGYLLEVSFINIKQRIGKPCVTTIHYHKSFIHDLSMDINLRRLTRHILDRVLSSSDIDRLTRLKWNILSSAQQSCIVY